MPPFKLYSAFLLLLKLALCEEDEDYIVSPLKLILVDINGSRENSRFLLEAARVLAARNNTVTVVWQHNNIELDGVVFKTFAGGVKLEDEHHSDATTIAKNNCINLMEDTELMSWLAVQNFTVAIVPLFMQDFCLLNYVKDLRVSTTVGVITNALQVPWVYYQSSKRIPLDEHYSSSLWSRLLQTKAIFDHIKMVENELNQPLRSVMTEKCQLKELSDLYEENLSLILTNMHPLMHTGLLEAEDVVAVGGFQAEGDYEHIADKVFEGSAAYRGVIFLSLSSDRPELRSVLLNMKQHLFLSSNDYLKDMPNYRPIPKHMSNSAILANPKTKVFVANCDSMDLFDSISSAVPTLCLPSTASENVSATMLSDMGVAITVRSADNEGADAIVTAIKLLIKERSYRANSRHLSEDLRDSPLLGSESLLYWVEYVHRHRVSNHHHNNNNNSGGKKRRSFMQLYHLDVVAGVMTIGLLLLLLLGGVAAYAFSRIWREVLFQDKVDKDKAE